MMFPCRRVAEPGSIGRAFQHEDSSMKWETPVAVDLRFGMEITMYVSNR